MPGWARLEEAGSEVTVVGVSQRLLVDPRTGERRVALDTRWARFLAACGIIGVPLPLDEELADAALLRTACRGVLLTGGDDLAELGGPTPERDRVEQHLLRRALACGRPVIGVCRGMQLILRVCGAPLVRVDGHAGTTHRLVGRWGGRSVNSFHRWAAVEVPPSMEVMAWSGPVVESVRLRGSPVLGIMWHPERTNPFDEADTELFCQLFRESAP